MRQSRQIARETNSQAVFNEIAERKLDARLEDTERYFYNDLSFQGIVFGERSYVIGRKGTGKTAIAEFIRIEGVRLLYDPALSLDDRHGNHISPVGRNVISGRSTATTITLRSVCQLY